MQQKKSTSKFVWIILCICAWILSARFIMGSISVFQDVFIRQRISGSWITICKAGDALWPLAIIYGVL